MLVSMDTSSCVEVKIWLELGSQSKVSAPVNSMGKNERSEDGIEGVE